MSYFEIDLSMVLDYFFSITGRNQITYPEITGLVRGLQKEHQYFVIDSYHDILHYRMRGKQCYTRYEDNDNREAGFKINPLHRIRVREGNYLEDYHLWRIKGDGFRKIFLEWADKLQTDSAKIEFRKDILQESIDSIEKMDDILVKELEHISEQLSIVQEEREALREEKKKIKNILNKRVKKEI